jgi:hypothetical protein
LKKVTALILSGVMITGLLFTGCSSSSEDDTSNLSSEFSVNNEQTDSNDEEQPKDGSQASTNISDITVVDGSTDEAVTQTAPQSSGEASTETAEASGTVDESELPDLEDAPNPFSAIGDEGASVDMVGAYMAVKQSDGTIAHFLDYQTDENPYGHVQIVYDGHNEALFSEGTTIKVVGTSGYVTVVDLKIPAIIASSVTQV